MKEDPYAVSAFYGKLAVIVATNFQFIQLGVERSCVQAHDLLNSSIFLLRNSIIAFIDDSPVRAILSPATSSSKGVLF